MVTGKVTFEMVRVEARWGEGLETNFFSFWNFLQRESSKEDSTGPEEQVVDAVGAGGELVAPGEQEHRALVHRAHPGPPRPGAHGLLRAEEGHVRAVLRGEELHLVRQVDGGGAGRGAAAPPREDHLGVDEVEAAGGHQQRVVAQGEAVAQEGAVRARSPAQRVPGAGVSNKVSGRFEGALCEVLLGVLMGSLRS